MATLSSHTLNGLDGTHAGGVAVSLVNLNTGRVLFESESDAGGRLSVDVDLTGMSPDDRYELIFSTSDYWQKQGIDHAQRIDEIVLRLSMPDPRARYHLPVILSPNSYSTWASQPE